MHGARIGGVNYSISGGRVRIGGTNYQIAKGKTRIGGTNYTISFEPPYPPTFAYNTASRYITNSSSDQPRTAAYGNGVIVCGAGALSLFISSNFGQTWTTVTLPDPETSAFKGNARIYNVAFGNGKFVALGKIRTSYDSDYDEYYDTQYVWISTNGTTWTASGTIGSEHTDIPEVTLVFTNGRFIETWSRVLFYSTDGINWTEGDGPSTDIFGRDRPIVYGNGVYMMLRKTDEIYVSTDLVTWTKRTGFTHEHGCLFYFDGAFWIFYNTGGTVVYAKKSTDKGVTWSSATTLSIRGEISGDYNGVRIANMGNYLLIKGLRDDLVHYSNNGTTWSTITLSPSTANARIACTDNESQVFILCDKTTFYLTE